MESGNGSKRYKAEEAIAGNSKALQALRELIIYPHLYYRKAQKIGVKWHRGLILHGPKGTGKTSLVRAVVRECDAHLTVISPHSVHSPNAGESERLLREAFVAASSHLKVGKPSVIFIDEIDAVFPLRNSRREQGSRLVSQLGILMDNVKPLSAFMPQVVVVASTNRVDAIDPALRRSGRFDTEIEVTTPTEVERFHILKLYTKKLLLDPIVDLQAIAASCHGYTGADLEELCRFAVEYSLKKHIDENQEAGMHTLTMVDWNYAKSNVGPSITKGFKAEIPDVSWDDIGGLKDVKKKLQQAVEWPLKHSAAFSRLGIQPVRGILLHGPPGCSKTTLAKAVAHAAKYSFFSLSGADLYSMYVGEGEAILRETFRIARLAAPSIIFLDEVDNFAVKRGNSSGSNTFGERVLSTLLTEMDGLEEAKGILVLAATNRVTEIDDALLRPGRFDLVLYVPPPDLEARYEILRLHTRDLNLATDVDLRQLAEDTELFNGAELQYICKEAAYVSTREYISGGAMSRDISDGLVCNRHFRIVRSSVKPQLTEEIMDPYSRYMNNQSTRSIGAIKSGAKQKTEGPLYFWGSKAPATTITLVVSIFSCVLMMRKYLVGLESHEAPLLIST